MNLLLGTGFLLFLSPEALADGSRPCSESEIADSQLALGMHPTPVLDLKLLVESNECLSYPDLPALPDGSLHIVEPAKFKLKLSLVQGESEEKIFQLERFLAIQFAINWTPFGRVDFPLLQRPADEIKVYDRNGKCVFSVLPPEFSGKIDVTKC